MNDTENLEYAGFWIRAVANFIDNILYMMVLIPVIIMVFGQNTLVEESISISAQIFISYILPVLVVMIFWIWKSATPGKMIFNLKILDATTGEPISALQSIGRYSGYFLSALPLFLGFIWVAFDKKKQGWHDKIANTVVVRVNKSEPVNFQNIS